MEITSVKLFKANKPGPIKAMGSVGIENKLWIPITVVEANEIFVSFPRRKVGEEWKDILAIKKELREKLSDAVLEEYMKLTGENQDAEFYDLNSDDEELPF